MPRSLLGFIARFSSLAAASIAAVAIASASQQPPDVGHRANAPSIEDAGHVTVSKAGETSMAAYSPDRIRIARLDNGKDGIGLLATRERANGESTASAVDSHRTADEIQPIEANHPLGLTSILATLALIAFFFLRRMI